MLASLRPVKRQRRTTSMPGTEVSVKSVYLLKYVCPRSPLKVGQVLNGQMRLQLRDSRNCDVNLLGNCNGQFPGNSIAEKCFVGADSAKRKSACWRQVYTYVLEPPTSSRRTPLFVTRMRRSDIQTGQSPAYANVLKSIANAQPDLQTTCVAAEPKYGSMLAAGLVLLGTTSDRS